MPFSPHPDVVDDGEKVAGRTVEDAEEIIGKGGLDQKETRDEDHGPAHGPAGGLQENQDVDGPQPDVQLGQVAPAEDIGVHVHQLVDLDEHGQKDQNQVHGEPGVDLLGKGFAPQGPDQEAQDQDKGQVGGAEGVGLQRTGIGHEKMVQRQGDGRQADAQLHRVAPGSVLFADQPLQDALFFLLLVLQYAAPGGLGYLALCRHCGLLRLFRWRSLPGSG